MKKITVEIIRETQKAKLVKDSEGREAWVQNRSYKDGLVNLTVFEKGVDFLLKRDEEKKELEKLEKEGIELENIVKETEKAIAIEINLESKDGEYTKTETVWFPKSLVKNGKAVYWFYNKKINEVMNYNPNFFIN